MQVVGIVLFSLLALFVVWLVIDTTIYIVKKVKSKKQSKEEKHEDVNNG